MDTHELHTLISEKIDVRWSEWATRHPHLAAAVDRVRLVDSAVERLRDDPEFIEALHAADLDEARLADASRLLKLVDEWIRRLFPM